MFIHPEPAARNNEEKYLSCGNSSTAEAYFLHPFLHSTLDIHIYKQKIYKCGGLDTRKEQC